MGRKSGMRLIVALGLVLGQVSTWALVGVSLPGCGRPTQNCAEDSDCRFDELCDGSFCVVIDDDPPSTNPSAPPSTPPGSGELDIRCDVEPGSGTIPRTVTLLAVVSGGTTLYHTTWDLGDSGVVMTTKASVEAPIIRPLRRVSAMVTDSGMPPKSTSCAVDVRFEPPALHVGCTAAPNSGRAPLDVQFTADPVGCVGPCTFSWDFGDGSGPVTRQGNNHVGHTYGGAGDFNAQVLLTDAVTGNPQYPERGGVCQTAITVTGPPTPPGSPSPPPGGNHAPSVTSITADAPTCAGASATSNVQCGVQDLDGDTVTVTPSASPSSGASFTPPVTSVPGGGGTATFTFQVTPAFGQTIMITCSTADPYGPGSTGTTSLHLPVCGGG